MNTIIITLSLICIVIEFWHIAYRFCFHKYFKSTIRIIRCAFAYDKLTKYFIEFMECYLDNEELQNKLKVNHKAKMVHILGMIDILKDIGCPVTGVRKILSLCSTKMLILFVLQQLVEVIYWSIIVVLLFITSRKYIFIFAMLVIMSFLQAKFNKKDNDIFHFIDFITCVILFVILVLLHC